MGLFDVFKGKKETKPQDNKKDVLPIVLKTDNVNKTLHEISKLHNISLSNIDFDILDIQTYIKFGDTNDYVLADEEAMSHLHEEAHLINNEVKIRQSYEIKVKKYEFVDDFELLGKMGVTKDFCKAIYSISPTSMIPYSPALEEYITNELNKKKLKSSLLVSVFEGSMIEDIEKVIAKIRVLGSLEDSTDIEICKGLPMIESVDGEVIEHYKDKIDKYDEFGDKVDFRKKGLVYPVEKEDVIIEVIKPKIGKNGRNCKGELLEAKEPKEIEIPKYIVNEDIEVLESDDNIIYKVNKNGYLSFDGDRISIKDELEIKQINLRTGSIVGAENSDVKLEVTENNALKEAIGDGMEVETTDLHVKGNIGSGAKIKTKKVVIEGQTHRKSKIASHEAEINIHRGYLKAHECKVHRLEGGLVEANKAHIVQATSGKVRAREIIVDILGSHITLISNHYIEIDTIKGSENNIIITSTEGDQESLIKSLEEKIKEGNISVRNLKEFYNKNREIILRNKSSVAQIKAKILQNKKDGVKTSPQLKIKLKKFNDLVDKTKDIELKIKNIREKVMRYKQQIDDIQIGVFGAKIVANSNWKEYNRLEFKLAEPPLNIVYDTKDDDMSGTYMLVEKGEMSYKIERVVKENR